MKRHSLLWTAVLVIGMLLPSVMPRATAKIPVVWAVADYPNAWLEPQRLVVEKFNLLQDRIELRMDVLGGALTFDDYLRTWLAASDETIDLVGPLGIARANAFEDQWLDLEPLAESAGYDLGQFPPALVDLYREPAGLTGLPFGVYPGVIYYNADHFDAAGLAYPPAQFGTPYMLDGKPVPWDYDTLAILARRLTTDQNGLTPNDPGFDPAAIQRFGFVNQWSSLRADFSAFGGAQVVNLGGEVVFPDAWRAQAHWLWNGLWQDHFIPAESYLTDEHLTYNPFASGKVAMARTMLWYTCCIDEVAFRWDIGVLPAYQGRTYVPVDADVFRIHKKTRNPEAAFTVLQYLIEEAAAELIDDYGSFPARIDLQPVYIEAKKKEFPVVEHWEVLSASLEHTAAPSHESFYPNYGKGQARFEEFRDLIFSDEGRNIDLDETFDVLRDDLQALVDEAAAGN